MIAATAKPRITRVSGIVTRMMIEPTNSAFQLTRLHQAEPIARCAKAVAMAVTLIEIAAANAIIACSIENSPFSFY